MNKEGGVSQLTDCSLRKDQKEETRIENYFLGIFAPSIQIVCTPGLTGSLAFSANHVKTYNAGKQKSDSALKMPPGKTDGARSELTIPCHLLSPLQMHHFSFLSLQLIYPPLLSRPTIISQSDECGPIKGIRCKVYWSHNRISIKVK